MSHAAIVCREYGMPAVVGTGHATKIIKTGMMIRVDGSTGAVRSRADEAAMGHMVAMPRRRRQAAVAARAAAGVLAAGLPQGLGARWSAASARRSAN